VSSLDALRRPDGSFAMIALDQRGSLRAMLAHNGAAPDDDAMRRFKAQASAALSPHASAVLLDRGLGLPGSGPPQLAPGCALVLAADAFVQPPGQVVQDSDIDGSVTPDLVAQTGAAALKFLLIWRPDGEAQHRADRVGRFGDLCRRSGVPGILEGVVRPADGDAWSDAAARDDAIVAAATELGALGKDHYDVYKAEIPAFGRDPHVVQRRARDITAVLPCPWVVLSTGVAPDAFPAAVAAARRGGASGFLAGRAIWSDATASDDPESVLRDVSVRRMRDAVAALSLPAAAESR